MIDLTEYNELAYQEAERKAYFSGDTKKASLIARIMELEEQLEEQKEQIEGLKDSISDFEDILNQIRDIV
jgi:methyl-accepting chemotaxis protein